MFSEEYRHELLNQALKGILAGIGHGSGATRKGVLVTLPAPIAPGDDVVAPELIRALRGHPDGAYVVIASKILAISHGRIVKVPKFPLPKRRSPSALRELLQTHATESVGAVSMRDAIGADLEYDSGSELTFSLLPASPNRDAFSIAERLKETTGVLCDVVITDTSAGWAKGTALIGAPTFVATPIGMTGGVDFFYAQRLASMAEVMRNEVRLAPFMIVDPPTDRSRQRERCGKRVKGSFASAVGSERYLE